MEESKNCPYCGKDIPAEAVFCPECGKRLSERQAGQTQAASLEQTAQQPQPTPSEKPEQPAKSHRLSKGQKIAIAVVAAVVVLGLIAAAVWHFTDQHNKQVWEQEHQTYAVSVSFNAQGYDPNTSTPIPVHVSGSDFEGNSVTEDHLIGGGSDDSISLMRGTYTISVSSSPFLQDGTIFDVSNAKVDLEVTGDVDQAGDADQGASSDDAGASQGDDASDAGATDGDASTDATATNAAITLVPLDPSTVTEDQINQAGDALVMAGVDQSTVQPFKDAALQKSEEVRQQAEAERQAQLASQVSAAYDQIIAEYQEASDNVSYNPDYYLHSTGKTIPHVNLDGLAWVAGTKENG